MKVEIVDSYESVAIDQWNALVKHCPQGSVFQTPGMYDFYDSVAGHTPFVVACVDKKGNLKALNLAVLLEEPGVKSFFSRRAVIFGGPLVEDGDEADYFLGELLSATVERLSRHAIYIETRNLSDYSKYKGVFAEYRWEYSEHLNFHLDCTDRAAMKKRMSESKVRQVRKSLEAGAEIFEAGDKGQVDEFYAILSRLYRKKVKTPLPGIDFFHNFLGSPLGKYLLVRYRGRIVGGIMCPILDEKTIYEWYICGEDGMHRNVYPSVLATWAAMDYANQKSIGLLDFMGAGPPGEKYGVRDFKARFGGEAVEHGRFLYVLKPFLYGVGKAVVGLMRGA